MTSLFDKYLENSDAFAGRGKPELSRAHHCLKVALIVVNVVFLIFACVLMGVGAYAYNNQNLGALTGVTLPLGIVTLGVFIMFLSFLGCLSAWRESRVFLGFYFFFLLLMTLLLLAVGIAVYVKKNQAGSYISSAWISAPNDLRGSLQQAFGCCGLNLYNDTYAVWSQCPIPACATANSGCPTCGTALSNEFYSQFNTVGTCGIVFAVLMIVITGVVCCLIRGIHQKNLKHDLGGLHGTDDSASPTSVPDPSTPGAGTGASAGVPSTTASGGNPPPVNTQV